MRKVYIVLLSLLIVGSSFAQKATQSGLRFNKKIKQSYQNQKPNYSSSKGIQSFAVESFEGAVFPPTGWTKQSPDGGTGWAIDTVGTSYFGWTPATNLIFAAPSGGTQVAYATYSTGGSASNDQWLITPQFSVAAGEGLSFYTLAAMSYIDTLEVYISTTTADVAAFTTKIMTLGAVSQTAWQHNTFNLSAYAGQQIYVGFREVVADNINNGGWVGLDLVETFTVPSIDAAMISMLTPVAGPNMTAAETVSIRIKNNGNNPLSNIPVYYRFNGGSLVTGSVAGPVAAGANADYTFTQTVDMTAVQAYNFVAGVNYSGDAVTTNDSIVTSVENFGNVILIGTASVTTCSGTFTDAEGGAADYLVNEDLTTTIIPATAGNRIRVSFSAFDTELDYDSLSVYDGNSVNAPFIGKFHGTTIPADITSSATDGSLTFHFVSDVTVVGAGWAATLSCVTPPSNDAGITSVALPAGYAREGDLTVNTVIKNNGTAAIPAGLAITYAYLGTTLGSAATLGSIAPGATETVAAIITSVLPGYYDSLVVSIPADGDLSNNIASLKIEVFPTSYLVESFEGITALPPANWTTTAWIIGTNPVNAKDGTQYAYVAAGTTSSMLSTPKLVVTPTDFVSFWAYSLAATAPPSIQLQYSADAATWTNIGTPITMTNKYVRYSVPLAVTGNYFIGFSCANASASSLRMDLVAHPDLFVGISPLASDNASGFEVYPNPTTGILSVPANTLVNVYNMIGQQVVSVNNVNTVDLSGLAEGAYIVKVQSDKNVTTKKITLVK